jgi:DNA-binding MarR family transcriptional regulator
MIEVEDDRAEYDPPRRLRRLPSWLTGQLARRAERLVGEALAQEGARRQHFTVLTSLAEQGTASQATIGRRLWIDRSDLHAILNELEREGLVARIRDEQDRRRNLVTLTPAGTAALERLDQRVQAAQSILLEPLSATDRRELLRLLERLVLHRSADANTPASTPREPRSARRRGRRRPRPGP